MRILSTKQFRKTCLLTATSSLLVSSLTPTLSNYKTVAETKSVTVTSTTSNVLEADSITGGGNFSAILMNGDVLVFGNNDSGQLGLGNYDSQNTPTVIPRSAFNNEKVVKVVASNANLIMLTETGKVYVTGGGVNVTKPTLAYEDPDIIDIDANTYTEVSKYQTFYLLMKDGTIRVSGVNYNGSFGNGLKGNGGLGDCTSSNTSELKDFNKHQVLLSATFETCSNNSNYQRIKTSVPLTKVKRISTNPLSNKVIAVTEDNELYYWGRNSKVFATKLNGSTAYNIVDAVYAKHPIFLTEEGEVYYYTSYTGSPIKLSLEDASVKAIKILAAEDNLLILGSNGKLYGFGVNEFGNLGPNIPESGNPFTTKVAAYTGISNVADFGMGIDHVIIQYKNGDYAGFGRNAYGELGSGDNNKTTFTKVPSLNNVVHVLASNRSSYASTTDNKLYSWGGKEEAQLLGRTGNSNVPGLAKDFSSLGEIVELNGYSEARSAGGVLLSNGTYWNFDYKYYNSIGNESGTSYTLAQVMNHNTAIKGPTKIISGIQANFSGAVVGSDGKLYSWGYDKFNMLGMGYPATSSDGETIGLDSFQEVKTPDGVTFTKIYGGNYTRFALADNGDVYAWGRNTTYRLGLGDTIAIEIPTKVPNLPAIKDIAIGRYHTLFLDYDGNIWSVGQGSYGALGLGDTKNRSKPEKISNLSNVAKVFAGDYDSFAVLKSGELYTWGRNEAGGLGLGDTIQRNEPRLVPGISNVNEVSAGFNHTLLATTNGNLYAAGSDGEMQLGLGSSQVNKNPVAITFVPSVTINNDDNLIYETSNTLKVTGTVQPLIFGYDIDVNYSLESKDGTTTTHLKTIKAANSTEPFEFDINLSDFSPGAYTVIVNAESSDGSQSYAAINFTVADYTPPTVTLNPTNSGGSYSLSPISLSLKADDQGGSGYKGYQYSITHSASKPTSWSALQSEKSGEFLLNQSGTYYVHIEVFDNAGNSSYVVGGPYNIDLEPPSLSISQPNGWQQDKVILTVTAQDNYGIAETKWMKGNVPLETIKSNGTSFTGNTVTVTANGVYTFYAKGVNGDEAIQVYTVEKINAQPILNKAPASVIIPEKDTANTTIQSNFTHSDTEDAVTASLKIDSQTYISSNKEIGQASNKDVEFKFDLTTLSPSTYQGTFSLSDSRGGSSTLKTVNVEIYKADLQATSRVNRMELSWNPSVLGSKYQVTRDGTAIYTGTNTTFTDSTNQGNLHTYNLYVWDGEKYVMVDSIKKQTFSFLEEIPSSISFPKFSLGSKKSIIPSSMDSEHLKFEEISDAPTPYSISISMTDFTSSNGNTIFPSLVWKDVKKISRSGSILKTFDDIHLSTTPVELVSNTETSKESYTHLELPRTGLELSIPNNTYLENGQETFTATMYWDILLVP